MTVADAIKYLSGLYDFLNAELFHITARKPEITIQPQGKHQRYAWITQKENWTVDGERAHELNLCAEYLTRDAYDVAEVLMHELVHYRNIVNGVKDTSRKGIYHNLHFKKTAEEHLLKVTLTEGAGYASTRLTDAAKALIAKAMMSGVFPSVSLGLARDDGYTPVEAKPNHSKAYACNCGRKIRGTCQDMDDIICGRCNSKFVER